MANLSIECLADFISRLRELGVNDSAVQEMTNRILADRVEAISDAAKAYHLDQPVSVLSFADKLSALTRKCYGVSAAITGLRELTSNSNDPMFNGVDQLIMDLTESAERLENDYLAVRALMSDKTSE